MLVISASIFSVPLLSSRVFAWLGERSFGLYLCHPPIVNLLRNVHHAIYALEIDTRLAALFCVGITLLVVIGIAEILFRVIEKPGMRLGELAIAKGWFRK